MLNYLAKLGWNDGTDKEIYTPAELCAAFSLEQIVKSAAVFDMDKLRWINAQHLRLRTAEQMRPVVLRELCSGADAILPASFVDATQVPAEKAGQFDSFMRAATMIAQRDMEVTTDSKQLVARCLEYDMQHTLATDAHVEEILAADTFPAVLKSLIGDFESGVMPRGGEPTFPELWKAYMKDLGKRLGLKGKALFHPVRLCMTGRVSGPDVGDQMQLEYFSEGLLDIAYAPKRRSVSERMAFLRSFDIDKALAEVKASQAAPAAVTTA
jgi:glutamyl-tRNA synthetase